MAVGTLIKLGGNLEDPRNAKPSDFTPGGGPEGKAGSVPPGANKLQKLSVEQEGLRHIEDDGPGTPSVWGKENGIKIEKTQREAGTSVPCPWGVDFNTGQTVPNAKMDDKY